jgi:hypothetical protein
MENEKTDPGIIKAKLIQEVKALREARREDRLEFAAESQRKNREYNELIGQHNDLVSEVVEAKDQILLLSSFLCGAISLSAMLIATALVEENIPLRVVVLATLISICVGFLVHTVASTEIEE